MSKDIKTSEQELVEAQKDRLLVKKGEVKFLTPEEVSERMKKKYGSISDKKKEK